MLLAMDIGNSTIKFGVFDGGYLNSKFSIPTIRTYSPEDLRQIIGNKLTGSIRNAIACSVVPEIDESLRAFCTEHLGVEVVFVNNSFDFGLKINYEPPSSLGIDRLVAAYAAAQKYGIPCIICDFGTATTIDAVNHNGEYLGGIIAPGMATMAEALHLTTSKLPIVEIAKPKNVIGNSTVLSVQSGIFYGYIGLVEGIISRIREELDQNTKVFATGGFASLIAKNCKKINAVDENLMLSGLNLIFKSDP